VILFRNCKNKEEQENRIHITPIEEIGGGGISDDVGSGMSETELAADYSKMSGV
jgi:hypothetical protein